MDYMQPKINDKNHLIQGGVSADGLVVLVFIRWCKDTDIFLKRNFLTYNPVGFRGLKNIILICNLLIYKLKRGIGFS